MLQLRMSREWVPRPSGRSSAELILLPIAASICSAPAQAQADENPFAAFSGEWTLKDDKFQFVGDGRNVQTQIIPKHHTKCDRVNTDSSVLCVVKAGELNGHMLWTFDASRKRVHWLSHFGTQRTGYGTGTFEAAGSLKFKLSFTDEPEGSYREYRYEWVTPAEYRMMSRQYDAEGRATGNWYGGTFIRLSVPRSGFGGDAAETPLISAVSESNGAGDVLDLRQALPFRAGEIGITTVRL